MRLYERGVRALVRRHSRPGEPQVEDFVQDVFFAALQRLRQGELRDPAALPAYLRTMVVRLTTEEYRRRARQSSYSREDANETAVTVDDPAETLRLEERAGQVRTLLAELPGERDRAVLARFYLDERSKDAVCAELGIDPDHFRRVLFRARERLRELIERAGAEGHLR